MNGIFAAWELNDFLQNLGTSGSFWAAAVVFIIGIAAVAIAAFQIIKGLASAGRAQTNWAFTILLLIIGGALMATSYGGWTLLNNVAQGANKTISDLGGGFILPF